MSNQILQALEKEIEKYIDGGICVAFSGGVDSSLLLKIACGLAQQKQQKVYAVFFDTFLHAKGDVSQAQLVAEECGAVFSVIPVNELENPLLQNNPRDRCYQCKKYLFTKLLAFAKQQHCSYVLDGTNEDDLHVYRPGLKALEELHIISPFAKLHITKKQVRILAKELGLSVASRPSNSCLATRLAYGMALEPALLSKIEQGELFLEQLGFQQIRLRVHGDILRIEISPEQMPLFAEKITQLRDYFQNFGFKHITVDLFGFRSGTMDL